MHPVSVLTFGIFLAGYITARWDLVTRLYELVIFAWDHGVIVRTRRARACTSTLTDGVVQTRAAKGFLILSIFFVALLIPLERIANREVSWIEKPLKRSSLILEQAELVGLAKPVHNAKARNSDRELQYPRASNSGISAREQLRRRGSF